MENLSNYISMLKSFKKYMQREELINFYSDCCLWNEIDFKVWILIHVVQERLDAQTERVEATHREPNSMDNTDTSDVNLKPKRCKA